MIYDTGLQNIVVGTPLQLKSPAGVSAQQLAALTIQNLSPLTIAVSIGGNQHTLPAYTSDQYVLASTGSPVTLVGTNQTGLDITGLTSQVDAIWYGPDDVAASGTFPSPLNPNPLALGIAVAEVLLQQGVPNVLLETPIVTGVLIPGNGQIGPFDISGSASMVIYAEQQTAGLSPKLDVIQLDPANNITDVEYQSVSSLRGEARISVTGVGLIIANLLTDPVRVWVMGSNRAALDRYDVRAFTSLGDHWSAPSAAYVVGQVVPMVEADVDVQLQGQVFLDFHINDATLRGTLFLTVPNGTNYNLAAAAELVQNTANQWGVCKMVAVPPATYGMSFVCTAAGSGSIVANMVPALI